MRKILLFLIIIATSILIGAGKKIPVKPSNIPEDANWVHMVGSTIIELTKL